MFSYQQDGVTLRFERVHVCAERERRDGLHTSQELESPLHRKRCRHVCAALLPEGKHWQHVRTSGDGYKELKLYHEPATLRIASQCSCQIRNPS